MDKTHYRISKGILKMHPHILVAKRSFHSFSLLPCLTVQEVAFTNFLLPLSFFATYKNSFTFPLPHLFYVCASGETVMSFFQPLNKHRKVIQSRYHLKIYFYPTFQLQDPKATYKSFNTIATCKNKNH